MKIALVREQYLYFTKDENPVIPIREKTIPVKLEFYEKTNKHDLYSLYLVCAMVNVTKDFDPFSDELQVIDNDTDSYQFRPKLIYKDSKGYYYKPYGKVVRLTEEECSMVDGLVDSLK